MELNIKGMIVDKSVLEKEDYNFGIYEYTCDVVFRNKILKNVRVMNGYAVRINPNGDKVLVFRLSDNPHLKIVKTELH